MIESTGISEPLPVAATFSFADERGDSLSDVARLDTMVTVVDAANLLRDYSSQDVLKDRGEIAGDGDERSLVQLLVEQIEFADVIVINKAGSVPADQLRVVKQLCASLNADARIVTCDHGRILLGEVLDTGLFDHDRAEQHPLWAKELFGYADHRPESEEYGIESFVYRARAPFDPSRFHDFATRSWPGVIRAKGHFWLATRPDYMGELAQAGAQTMSAMLGRWWAAVPSERWPSGDVFDQWVRPKWDPVWGDRRQELVFIGIGMDEARLRADLDACLVEAIAFTPAVWRDMPDPFPAWGPPASQVA